MGVRVVVRVAHLDGMTTTTPAVPASVPTRSVAARAAAVSRAAQGLRPSVTDAGVLERLAALCARPRAPRHDTTGSGFPDELNPAGQ
jgi:hypothetical protein